MIEFAGKQIPNTLAEIVEPSRTALLIWDMEYAIGPNAFNYKDMLPKLQGLAVLARSVGARVFYSVQTGFDIAKEEAGVWVRIRMKRAKTTDPQKLLHEKEDPHDREIITELKPQPQDIIFQKRRPDGFVGTDLDLMLRSNGIKTVVVGGCTTEGCVESTARDAMFNDFYVVIAEDCVASDDRAQHEASMLLMRHRFDIAAGDEIGRLWHARPPGRTGARG